MALKENQTNSHSFKGTTAWKASIIAILAATALGGNYALSGIPNVEISSVIVFISGFLFGISIGALVGFTTMTIYQFLNPWGAFVPPIGGAVIACTIFIGIIGGITGRKSQLGKKADTVWVEGLVFLGITTTLFFDLVTNYAYSITFGIPYLVALAIGLPFLLIHIVSNGMLFGLLTPSIAQVIEQINL